MIFIYRSCSCSLLVWEASKKYICKCEIIQINNYDQTDICFRKAYPAVLKICYPVFSLIRI